MNGRMGLYPGVGILLLFLGCGPKVRIPPEADLMKYESVGLIGFDCDAEGNMDEYITEKFLQRIKGYQKEARIIELGGQDEVLNSVRAYQMNEQAIQAIGQKYNVNAVITGNVKIDMVKPIVELYPEYIETSVKTPVEGMRVKAAVKMTISSRLWETEQGATIWTASVGDEGMVNEVSVLQDRKVVFDTKDPLDAYRDLVRPLIRKISTDFEVKYKRIKQNR